MPEEKSLEQRDEDPSVANPSSRRRRVAAVLSRTPTDAMPEISRPGVRGAGLEINARTQAEHLVTEMVTGVDIVEQKTRLANGGPLSLSAVPL